MAEIKDVAKSPFFMLKIVQIVLAIICISLLQDSLFVAFLSNVHKIALVYMVFCGYILISLMEISRMFEGEKSKSTLVMLWALVGAVLWITAGALVIELYRQIDGIPGINAVGVKSGLNKVISAGIIALVNALAYFVEISIGFKFG